MTSSPILYALCFVCVAVHAQIACQIDPQLDVPVCSETLFHGHCVRPYIAATDKWCTWEQRNLAVCCATRDSECCTASSSTGQFALTIVLVILIACCCCCIALSRSAVNPSNPRRGIWYRLTARIPVVRRHYERQATFQSMPNQLNRDATMREPTPQFVFPKLKPLEMEAKECIVCFVEPRETVLPCGHSLLCEDCTKLILARNQPCPNCRAYFSNYVVAEKQPTFRDLRSLNDKEDENAHDSSDDSPEHSSEHSTVVPTMHDDAPTEFANQTMELPELDDDDDEIDGSRGEALSEARRGSDDSHASTTMS